MRHHLHYDPDDDASATAALTDELRAPDLERWRAMLHDDYILQTHRVLGVLERDLRADLTRRRSEVENSRLALRAGDTTEEQHRALTERYNEWRNDALHSNNKLRDRLKQTTPRVRNMLGDAALDHTRATLIALAYAVAEHRNALTTSGRTPTADDRLLWARLDTLAYPVDRGFPGNSLNLVPLINAVAEHPDPASAAPAPQPGPEPTSTADQADSGTPAPVS